MSSKAAPAFGGIMGKKLYVGNLPFSVNDSSLQSHFSAIGNVTSAKVITDRDTGRSKGFGFVEMSTDDEAQAAISKLDGSAFEGRNMTVNEAKPMAPREDRGGFGGGNGGGGRGRY
jgi:RNA recognition motif-containing protein